MWRERRLAFRHHTLVEIADEFNRYNKSPKLRVEGESLKLRTFSGVMDANDPQTLLDYLANDERIEFNRDDPSLIIIRFRSRYGFARVGQ
jgi:ferric-dicitrate binding protein FerR (iron transport regulator)